MATIDIKSRFGSFEEHGSFIGQAQRCLFLCAMEDLNPDDLNIENPKNWLLDYLVDIYFNSLCGPELSNFYLQDEDFEIFDHNDRRIKLISIIEKTISFVMTATDSELEKYLMERRPYEKKVFDYFDESLFTNNRKQEDYIGPNVRVLYVLINLKKLLNKEETFTLNEVKGIEKEMWKNECKG